MTKLMTLAEEVDERSRETRDGLVRPLTSISPFPLIDHSFLPHNAEFFEFTTRTLCYRPPCSIATQQSVIELSSNPSNAICPSLIII